MVAAQRGSQALCSAARAPGALTSLTDTKRRLAANWSRGLSGRPLLRQPRAVVTIPHLFGVRVRADFQSPAPLTTR